MVEGAYHETEELVRRNPATSALTTFGVGFGLGLLLTTLLLPKRTNWYDSYMPDLTSGWSNRGHQFADAFSRMMPDSFSRHHRSWF